MKIQWKFNEISIQWKFNENSISIQWLNFSSMKIQFQFNENSMKIQWKFNENSMKIQWKFNENSMKIQWKFNENSMKIQWKFNENSMKIQWKFNENSMKIQWKFNENSMKIQWKFNESSISIQRKFNFNSIKFQFNENSVKIQFQFNESSMKIQWKFNENSMKVQWKFNENSMKIQWKFNFNSMKVQFQFNESSISIQWKFNFNSMKIQWNFNESSISIQFQFNENQSQFNENSISIQWKFNFNAQSILGRIYGNQPQLLPPFVANKMEESLRNLADSLGECSRLVSQVLAIGRSSANWNVTDSGIHGVSGNNFSSTSNVACCKEVEGQDCILAWVNGSDFEQHHLPPYLVAVEQRNKTQHQNNLNSLMRVSHSRREINDGFTARVLMWFSIVCSTYENGVSGDSHYTRSCSMSKAIQLERFTVLSRTTFCTCKSLIFVSLLLIYSSVLSSTDDKKSGKSFSTSNSDSIRAIFLVKCSRGK